METLTSSRAQGSLSSHQENTGAGQEQFKYPSGEGGGDAREMGDKNRPHSVSHRTACSNKNPTVSISAYL